MIRCGDSIAAMTECDAAPSARPQTEIDRLAERWLQTQIELAPERRVELGAPGDQSEYGDYSPQGTARRREAMAAMLAELDRTRPADEIDRVTVMELRRDLELQIEGIDAGLPSRDVNNIASSAQEMPSDCVPVFPAVLVINVTNTDNTG